MTKNVEVNKIKKVGVVEARSNLGWLLSDVAAHKTTYEITKNGKKLGLLTPLPTGLTNKKQKSKSSNKGWKGLAELSKKLAEYNKGKVDINEIMDQIRR